MNNLTLGDFDKELEKRISDHARREGLSLNEAALQLLRRGAELLETDSASGPVGEALDRFIGRWSTADEEALLLESIASCETVDEALWK